MMAGGEERNIAPRRCRQVRFTTEDEGGRGRKRRSLPDNEGMFDSRPRMRAGRRGKGRSHQDDVGRLDSRRRTRAEGGEREDRFQTMTVGSNHGRGQGQEGEEGKIASRQYRQVRTTTEDEGGRRRKRRGCT